jgi:hypothetical protein
MGVSSGNSCTGHFLTLYERLILLRPHSVDAGRQDNPRLPEHGDKFMAVPERIDAAT